MSMLPGLSTSIYCSQNRRTSRQRRTNRHQDLIHLCTRGGGRRPGRSVRDAGAGLRDGCQAFCAAGDEHDAGSSGIYVDDDLGADAGRGAAGARHAANGSAARVRGGRGRAAVAGHARHGDGGDGGAGVDVEGVVRAPGVRGDSHLRANKGVS